MPKLRMKNGYGQIAQIKAPRLRNRYRVRVIASRDPVTNFPEYKTLGYYRTYSDACIALADYHKAPRPLLRLTLEELYNEWISFYPKDNNLSKSRTAQFTTIWNHVSIKTAFIADLKPSDIRQELLRDMPRSIPKIMLNLFQLLYDHAVAEGYVTVNIARQVSLPKVVSEREKNGKRQKTAFTEEDIDKIREEVGKSAIADILYYSIFSGWRPSEALELLSVNVNLKMGFAVGGKKTAAGTNRTVPIHPEAAPILARYLKKKTPTVFGKITYEFYKNGFNRLMNKLDIKDHTPHDARRTFITLAKMNMVDQYAIKLIVGHSIRDITESIYTDRPVSWLIDELNKIKLTKDKEKKAVI